MRTLKLHIVNLTKGTNLNYIFYQCYALENITFEGYIKQDLDLSSSKKLTIESLMSVINALYDFSGTTTTKTLTIGKTNLAKLTDDEYSELIDLARGNSDFKNSVDLMEKINELEKRVRALEENGSSSSDGTTTEETIEEYIAGKWYYNGDKCSFEGKTYKCIAPDDVVCVWSPKDYPAYWEEIH